MEQYIVKFWVQDLGGYWSQNEKVYECKGKSSHKKVKKMWENDFRSKNVNLIVIEYC